MENIHMEILVSWRVNTALPCDVNYLAYNLHRRIHNGTGVGMWRVCILFMVRKCCSVYSSKVILLSSMT